MRMLRVGSMCTPQQTPQKPSHASCSCRHECSLKNTCTASYKQATDHVLCMTRVTHSLLDPSAASMPHTLAQPLLRAVWLACTGRRCTRSSHCHSHEALDVWLPCAPPSCTAEPRVQLGEYCASSSSRGARLAVAAVALLQLRVVEELLRRRGRGGSTTRRRHVAARRPDAKRQGAGLSLWVWVHGCGVTRFFCVDVTKELL